MSRESGRRRQRSARDAIEDFNAEQRRAREAHGAGFNCPFCGGKVDRDGKRVNGG